MIIGLTGGIASGKSTAASLLREWGAHGIDADKLGHRAYLAGTTAFDQVVSAFGEHVVGADGEIDRAKLGAQVFGANNRLDELTAIVWPAIRAMAQAEINAQPTEKIVVLEAAVLIEAGWQNLVDQIWVVVVDPDVAVARATARDGVEASAVQARIDAQLTNQERCAAADQIIDNSQGVPELTKVLQNIWHNVQGAT